MAAIDVGAASTNRSGAGTLFTPAGARYYTLIEFTNPANDTGTIDTVKAWFQTALSSNSCKIGTFDNTASTTFVCNDAESIGEVTSGSEQTFSGLSIDINSGEYIGADARAAYQLVLEKDATGGSGVYYKEGQFCDPTDSESYSLFTDDIMSLNGEGETAAGGWANIGKVNGITATDLAKVNGVAVASIAKMNGVAV